ncbi:enoyl-CoA hydratase/isomerase family protein [Adlercreutzia sp. ZJ138]|uniref:enoyl-CoA hydratase/isomerase family protein n=1 Tax=Adlercreutzia sp. ZJ138 TaxID=2709405 RepID=UPI0013EC6365|nr:enoyl-CoA hydratase/isomerase family protein [Adlercreutzia sp. ZJ138]
MTDQKVIYKVEDGVSIVSMNCAENLNAMDGALIEQLTEAFERAASDESSRAILLNSATRIFCSGGDLKTMYKGVKTGEVDFDAELSGAAGIMKAMRTNPKPIVGAVNGVAAGAGFPLALGCDYLIADENASFVSAFVNVGLIPDTGGVFVLSRIIGESKTREIVFTGRPVSAAEAKDLGFVAEVVPAEDLAAVSMKQAKRFAKGPALSYQKMKELLWQSNYEGWDEYAEQEVAAQSACMHSQDFNNRVIAFVEKKK